MESINKHEIWGKGKLVGQNHPPQTERHLVDPHSPPSGKE